MPRLLVDAMCGDLLAYLRMCGYDAVYAPDRGLESDDELLVVADDEERTIVTRDRQLAERAQEAICLESQDTERQLTSLAAAGLDLQLPDEPSRCGQCNGDLVRLDGDASRPGYAPDSDEAPVWYCEDCGQCFWCGSHWDRVAATLERVRSSVQDDVGRQ